MRHTARYGARPGAARGRGALAALTILLAATAGELGAQAAAGGRGVAAPRNRVALDLADFGSFFVNGTVVTTAFPNAPATGAPPVPGRYVLNQMYVQYMIPARARGAWPVVMVHGSNHTGKTYETTPDGREGWATYFARAGFPVYVVDHAGRGRSGFDPSPFNQAKVQADPALIPNLNRGTIEAQFTNFRFGPAAGAWWPDSRFPIRAAEQYYAQLVPNAEATLAGGGANTVAALAALLDTIGPAIVMVHSQSGSYGLDLVRRRPDLVKALIDVEGNCAPVTPEEVQSVFARVPFLAVWGDHSEGAVGANGDARRNGCVATVGALQAAGGTATFLLLPALGIRGNTHMMMMDRNNLEIADLILGWARLNVPRRPRGR